MIKNRSIIYLAGHDFCLTDCKISTDHIADILSRDNKLLYVESVGMRAPRLNANDMGRILRKLKGFFRRPRKINENLHVFTPLAIPYHGNPLVARINRLLMRVMLRRVAGRLGMTDPILFVFLPQMYGVVGRLGESLSVYYCTDEHSEFPGVDREATRRMETELLRKVDLGFATSPQILDRKKEINPNFHLSIHGVEFDNFSRAMAPETTVPEEIKDLKGPVIGYFGAIDSWMDLDLMEYLARSRPGWSFLFIGKCVVDVSRLDRYPNVRFIGKRPFEELPRYGKAFSAAIIPFALNDLTRYVFPIKLKEYLSMGKPVVSSPMPPVEWFNDENPGMIEIGRGREDFLEKLDHAIKTDNPEMAGKRLSSVRGDTWEARVERISEIIEKQLG